jgi:hypothetical protein
MCTIEKQIDSSSAWMYTLRRTVLVIQCSSYSARHTVVVYREGINRTSSPTNEKELKSHKYKYHGNKYGKMNSKQNK